MRRGCLVSGTWGMTILTGRRTGVLSRWSIIGVGVWLRFRTHWGNDYFDDTLLVNGEPRQFKGYCTDVFFTEAMKFIKTNKDKPFLCFITPNAPHSPYNVEKKYRDLYAEEDMPDDRKRFYGMITNIDENFQRLRGFLKEQELEDDTILIFMTDNGTAKGADYDEQMFISGGYNAGMRGIKASAYEGGHRVPFFLRYPAGRNQ